MNRQVFIAIMAMQILTPFLIAALFKGDQEAIFWLTGILVIIAMAAAALYDDPAIEITHAPDPT